MNHEFVICVKNSDYPASLELRKLYEVLPDSTAKERRLLRVIDESGEDYLYPENFFVSVRLEEPARRAVRRAGNADPASLLRATSVG